MAAHLQEQEEINVAGHLEKRRGYWHMAVSWPMPDGGRERQYRTTGLPIKGNKKRAGEILDEFILEKQKQLNRMSFDSAMLFADFMEYHWLPYMRGEVKLSTFGGYQTNVERKIAPYFREREISLRDLTKDDVLDYYKHEMDVNGLKATSVHKFHTNIKKTLDYAIEQNLLRHSIMSQVKRPKKKRFAAKFLRQSEVIKLFSAVRGHELELPVILGAFYGLRRAEVVGLRWEAISFETNTITIEHTVTSATVDGKRIDIADDTGKSKSSLRSLPLVPEFRNKLLEIELEQERNRKLYGRSYNRRDSEYIYTDQLGNRIRPDYISRRFPVFLDQHGLRRVRFHDLRHTAASLLLNNGVELNDVKDWLGHSEIGITADTYGHLEYKKKEQSAAAMTWIEDTVLALPESQRKQEEAVPIDQNSAIPDFVHQLLLSGVPLEVIQGCLKDNNLMMPVAQKNNQPVLAKQTG